VTLGVLEGARFVCERASHVSLDSDSLHNLALELLPVPSPTWDIRHHFADGTSRTVSYLLLVDALNFCFFPDPRWQVAVDGEMLQGYFALTTILKRAFEEKAPVTEFRRLAHIGEGEARDLLQGTPRIGVVPLLTERVGILREIGEGVTALHGGDPARLVLDAQGSAERLVRQLVQAFPSFRDEATYDGEKIPFYKRAQIFAGDLHSSFRGEFFGRFADVASLTAFADYKIPQILRACGVLRYSPSLADGVDRKDWIAAGSPQEVEIRAATVWSVELLRRELVRLRRPLLATEIDWLLWQASQSRAMPPHHCTLTTSY